MANAPQQANQADQGNEFSELAIQKLLQLFPELSSLIVTFKDITDDTSSLEDTDISVGIFILQVAQNSYYLPIIAKGDAIQPLDSVFDNTEQCFVPLTKSFVTRIVNSSPQTLGQATKIPDTVSQNPSIYSLVTPPRTGKFVYASSSRLEEFLTTLPNIVKEAVLDKFSSDKDTYSALHKLFGLENLFAALKPTIHPETVEPKPAVELVTEGSGLGNKEVQDILEKGYSLRGENTTTRVAVLANDFATMGKLHQISFSDAGRDYDICTKVGVNRTAWIPKHSKYLPQKPAILRSRNHLQTTQLGRDSTGDDLVDLLAIFENGDFTYSAQLVAVGEGRDGKKTLQDYLSYKPAITPGELTNQDDYFLLLSPELELIGAFQYPKITKTAHGVTIEASSANPRGHSVVINAFRNCTTINCQDIHNIFIPINTVVVKLNKKLWSGEIFEKNINAAASRQELATLTALGSAVNLGYDGVEFHVNKQPVGDQASVMRILVVEEGIAPEKAESFVKQAMERKYVRIFLTKKADAEQDIIPSYGQTPPQQQTGFGINGDFNTSVNNAAATGDAEIVESTIISELLQVQEMRSYINEYLPEIKNAIDKLGRALFLARLKMDELSQTHNASEIFSFIANLRTTYRSLGDTYIKLADMTANSETEALEAQ